MVNEGHWFNAPNGFKLGAGHMLMCTESSYPVQTILLNTDFVHTDYITCWWRSRADFNERDVSQTLDSGINE